MTVDVAVVGLGYVGLPLALEASRHGVSVLGLDLSESVVSGLMSGRSHVDDLSDQDVAGLLERGFVATTDPGRLAEAQTIVICVPTPLSEEGGPDLAAVDSAVAAVAAVLRPGMTVILESTTYPGTTDERVRPVLERASGLVAGADFHLAFSPERIDPGNPHFGMANTPKVVGGHTPGCTAAAAGFYSRFVEQVVPVSGTREAEMAKLLENTYRHVNIALVNEMARFCHDLGIDIWEVVRAAATKPFGYQAFYPGPGVGGHCIPIDPNYLAHSVKARLGYPFRFVELAQEINSRMPAYVVERAQDALNEQGKALRGSRVLLLGVTYKRDIADERESPAVPVARGLIAKGATLLFHDPLVRRWSALGDDAVAVDDPIAAAGEADLTILLQDHAAYEVDRLAGAARSFLDTRGKAQRTETVSRL